MSFDPWAIYEQTQRDIEALASRNRIPREEAAALMLKHNIIPRLEKEQNENIDG